MNDYYVNVVKNIQNDIVKPSVNFYELLDKVNVGPYQFHWNVVTVEDVLNVVAKLKSSSSMDFFGMSNNFVKEVVAYIAEPLSMCINLCLEEGTFPSFLKISKVVPIFKSGDRCNPANYRPVSLVPILAKIFENVIFNQLSYFFEVYNLLSSQQFGFKKGCSTMSAIDALVQEIIEAFEKREFAWATFCDLSKAFDCVDHNMLLYKLQHYGISGGALKLFRDYLVNRKQVVFVNGEQSSLADVVCGVPQGSVLGPFLFLIAINDLPYNIDSSTYLYADDTTFVSCGSSIELLEQSVTDVLRTSSSWFAANSFLLNNSKTQTVVFSLRQVIENASFNSHVKFLGVTLDQQLSWNAHLESLETKLARVVFLLSRLLHCVPINYVRSAYFAFFQSIMSYGIVFWGHTPKANKILMLQKKIVRILTKSDWQAHCRPLFVELSILTVTNLYIFNLLIYTYNKYGGLSLRQNIHHFNTRHKNLIDVPFVRLEKTRNSHLVIGLRMFNLLPEAVKTLNFKSFKNRIFNFLVKNPFYCINEFLDLKPICDI